MPKLKGLLDTARTKLTGLLGDFPQGFNAGAVAGFPGWAGDMAYMADTARLALTGADSQIPAAEFPGTTDYIASQAGYPVPQSISGQLGAAVGGMLSPGPGDLGRLAPVLSAIPFWHGSPHKFDAFDLAHMGKGEGAQAYGWGAYGAESPEVAKQYLNVDPSVPVPPRRQFMGQDLEPGTPEYHAARLASEGKESLAGLRKLVAGWISDARPGEPTDGYQKTLEILNQAQKKSDFKQLKPEPYLYRGEYRWPDPAKEAATPLTGEDLLQWDRPLSEQPESFRDALIGLPEIQARISASERQRVKLNELHPARIGKIPSADKPIDASRITGDEVISTLRQSGLSEADVSKKLLEMGIPGTRYLDGNSRPYMDATTRVVEDGGKWFGEVRNPDTSTHYSGVQLSDYFDTKAEAEAWVNKTLGKPTHNIVMFDDKGIKLLERNGNPIEDFAARRAGKAKPYKEAVGDEQARTLQDIVGQYEAQGLKLDAFQNSSNPDVVTLSRIQVPEAQRGQGIGSQAMADLVRYADEQGKTIALSPSTDFGASSVARLRDFYKRFGFVDNAGRSKDYELSESMYRRPGAQ